MKPQIPWLRVFVEGVVIVGSILLAFGIDAAWTERGERAEEQRVPLSLQSDFVATRAEFVQTVVGMESVRENLMILIGLASDDEATTSSDHLNELIEQSVWMSIPRPQLSTYEEIVNSGSLRLIESDSLRLTMATLIDEIDTVQNSYDMLRERWTTLEEPYLIENVDVAQVFQGGLLGLEFPAVSSGVDPNEIVHTLEFKNLWAGRVVLVSAIVGMNEGVVDRLDVALDLVRREIS